MKMDSFNRLYADYHKLVLHVAFDILHDDKLAEDVCQEVFIKMGKKIERLDEDKIKGWILRNTHRKAIDFWRRAYRRREVPTEGAKIEQTLLTECLVDEVAEGRRKEFRDKLLDALKAKDPVWYDLMVRVVVENEPAEDVAREYGMTVMGMRMRISRARRWLYENYYRDYKGMKDR